MYHHLLKIIQTAIQDICISSFKNMNSSTTVMAGFSNLPTEIVVEIWKYIFIPDDIESFARISTKAYTCGEPFLREHRHLKAKYGSIANGSPNLGPNGSVLFPLLKDILLQLHLALYDRRFHVTSYLTSWEDWKTEWIGRSRTYSIPEHMERNNRLRHVSYPSEDLELFVSAIRSARDLLPGNSEDWCEEVREGNEDRVNALLLTMLPNIEELSLQHIKCRTKIYETLQHIQWLSDTPLLLHLDRVYLTRFPGMSDDMSIIGPFLGLPSVKSIKCDAVDDLKYHYDHKDRSEIDRLCFDSRKSNVESLEFMNCQSIARGLPHILKRTKHLRDLIYHNLKRDRIFSREVSAVCIELEKHTKDSLRTLLINTAFAFNLGDPIALQRFKKIKVCRDKCMLVATTR